MALKHRGANLVNGSPIWKEAWKTGVTGPISGTDYLWVSNPQIDYLISKGMNTFRLLFSWEALQPTPKASLPGALKGNFRVFYDRFKEIVDYITAKGCSVILDIHGGDDPTFAAYYGVKVGLSYTPPGSGVSYPVSDLLVDLWSQLATIFKANPKVMFGITNEPFGIPTMTWFATAQRVINAIRATGATQMILMPGNYYSGAGSWTYTGSMFDTGSPKRSNAYGWLNANGVDRRLSDPANNLAAQVHLYLDKDAAGGVTQIESATIGAERLAVVTDWGRANNVKVMVCEVGFAASNPIANEAWANLINYMNANQDVILGFQWWAYGPPTWWGNYQFTLCPNASGDSPQMKLIEKSLKVGLTQAEVDALLAENSALKSQVGTLQTENSTLKSQASTLQTENSTLKSQAGTLQAQVGTLQAQASSLQTQVGTLQTENSTLMSEVDALKAENNGLKALEAEVATLRSEVETLRGEVTSLQAQVSANDAHVASLGAEIGSLQTQVNDLETENSALTTQVKSLKSRVTALKSQVAALKAQIG